MNAAAGLTDGCPPATDGEIAVMNLRSGRRRSWSRFSDDPHRPGVAELIVEQESQMIEFLSDFNALDRLEMLAKQIIEAGLPLARRALVQARVAAMAHRFDEARRHLAEAEDAGAGPDLVNRLALSIDQACGVRVGALLETRRRIAAEANSLEELLPLGAVLMDLNEFDEADAVFRHALRVYSDVSPFAVAQVCFQLGVLWGEVAPEPRTHVAAQWYRKAIGYVPAYTKARVHLAEICCAHGALDEAEALLTPVIGSGDPEVRWRLADTLLEKGNTADAQGHLRAACLRFEELLARYPLAFADHGAEFFAGSGNDFRRALDHARRNAVNRPTPRAFALAQRIAVLAGDDAAASALIMEARAQWDDTAAFRSSRLADASEKCSEGLGKG
jgi:tetratricopeptide (TPR) repeat protein